MYIVSIRSMDCITSVSVFRYYLTEFIYLFLIEIVLITYQFWYHFKVIPKPELGVYFQYITYVISDDYSQLSLK